MTAAAVEAGAQAWFDHIQAQRLDAGRKRPDGLRWQWEDLTEGDRRGYRALAEPIVTAALSAVLSAASPTVCAKPERQASGHPERGPVTMDAAPHDPQPAPAGDRPAASSAAGAS